MMKQSVLGQTLGNLSYSESSLPNQQLNRTESVIPLVSPSIHSRNQIIDNDIQQYSKTTKNIMNKNLNDITAN